MKHYGSFNIDKFISCLTCGFPTELAIWSVNDRGCCIRFLIWEKLLVRFPTKTGEESCNTRRSPTTPTIPKRAKRGRKFLWVQVLTIYWEHVATVAATKVEVGAKHMGIDIGGSWLKWLWNKRTWGFMMASWGSQSLGVGIDSDVAKGCQRPKVLGPLGISFLGWQAVPWFGLQVKSLKPGNPGLDALFFLWQWKLGKWHGNQFWWKTAE